MCEAERKEPSHGKMTPPMHSMGGIINLTLLHNIISLPAAAKDLSPAFIYGGHYCVVANETRRHVGKLDFSFGAVDGNLYHTEANMTIVFPKSSRPAPSCTETDKQGVSFSTWQHAGFDRHSSISDPGFVGNGNYSLQANSSARKLGIVSLDSSTIGLFSTRIKSDDHKASSITVASVLRHGVWAPFWGETTPVLWKDRLTRMETRYPQPCAPGNFSGQGGYAHLRVRDIEARKITIDPIPQSDGVSYGSGFVLNSTEFYAFGSNWCMHNCGEHYSTDCP